MTSKLSTWAAEISANAGILDDYFSKHGSGIEWNSPFEAVIDDPDVEKARIKLARSAKRLYDLTTPVFKSIREDGINGLMLTCVLEVSSKFEIFELVPLDGEMSVGDLAEKSSIKEAILLRLVKMAAANYCFTEPRPGYVAHTSRSRALLAQPGLRALIELMVKLIMPATSQLSATLLTNPAMDSAEHTPFFLAFGSSVFHYLNDHPSKQEMFARAMHGVYEFEDIASAYSWSQFDRAIVDVGSGRGHVSVAIDEKHPNVHVILEDLPGLEDQANAYISSRDCRTRVKFLSQDIFDPQPPESPRSLSIPPRIIKNIVNVMEPDSKIILSEWCFPSCEVDEEQEVKSRREDINMLVMFNGSQRTVEGWERLCQSVNKRLYVSKIIAPPVVKRNLVEISLMKECREANHEEGT